MPTVGMRLACCCLAAWVLVSVSQPSSTGLAPAAEEESQLRGQSRDSDNNDVDLSREQKQQKWAFLPHNPSALGERSVTNQDSGVSSSNAVDSRSTQNEFAEERLRRDRTNANRPSQSLNDNVDPVTSSEVHAVDDRTLLDIFAESAKEYLTTRLVSVLQLDRVVERLALHLSIDALTFRFRTYEDPPIRP